MYKTVAGKYEEGVVRLTESTSDLPNGPVLVTFLKIEARDSCPLSPVELVEVRNQLAAWEDDWSAPGMEIYDQH
jgi:hypothetical protein